MNRSPEVCLVALTFVAAVVVAIPSPAQEMRKGISVQMAVTNNASPMPEADKADSWIVTVTRDGSLYFGTDQVTPEGLFDAMKVRPRNRQAKLYVKADARAPFADVEKALATGHAAYFEVAVLLTSPPASPAPGMVVPPKGLEVLLAPPSSAGSNIPVVQVIDSGEQSPTLKINDQPVAWDALQSTLELLVQNQREKVVVVRAGGKPPFAPIAHVIDVGRSTGARVILPAPEL